MSSFMLRSLVLGLALVVAGADGAAASSSKSKIELAATAAAPDARGKATLVVRSASKGRFEVRVGRLAPDTSYELLVGGVKVTTLLTRKGGSAKVRFSNKANGKDLVLGFDPRGEAIEVRDAAGNDVLTGTLPAGATSDPGDVTCCIPDDGAAECEDRTAAECSAQGGTVVAAGSCLPDPCGAVPPVDTDVVCCLPDDSGPECEDRTQAECAAQGGTMVEAASCAPNPCQGTPLPDDADVLCCRPNLAGDEMECEDRTTAQCALEGGVSKGAGVCAIDTCADVPPPNPDVQCCLPNLAGDEIECEDRSAAQCAAEGGVSKGAGVCAIDTCADVAPPNPDVQCCVPDNGGFECEDRTPARCAERGGTVRGAGACTPTSCADL